MYKRQLWLPELPFGTRILSVVTLADISTGKAGGAALAFNAWLLAALATGGGKTALRMTGAA